MKSNDFKFNLGDMVEDIVTGFSGIVVVRCQWLNNCNTYGVQPVELKDGVPRERIYFDEPQLRLLRSGVFESSRSTGGPERGISETNR